MIRDKEFLDMVVYELKMRMGTDYDIRVKETFGNNGVMRTGICAGRKDSELVPVIYLEKDYEEYRKGREPEAIAEELSKTFLREKGTADSWFSNLPDFSRLRDRVVFRLINREANRKMLEDMPFVEYHDLAVVFRLFLEVNEWGQITAPIYQTNLEEWNISVFELLRLAVKNTPRLLPICLKPMEEILGELSHVAPEALLFPEASENAGVKMYVLSNETGMYGASALLYDGCLEQAAETMESDLIVIPSSTQEVILIDYDEERENVSFLNEMVHEVNETMVCKEERLSDHIYIYRRQNGYLELAKE